MVTRPDLAFAVSQVSQFMHAPRSTYVETIDRILRYLKNTRKRNIDEKNIFLIIYVDTPIQIGPESSIENSQLAIAHLYMGI
jgi:hypothetical protein